jgi:hypothetical protein
MSHPVMAILASGVPLTLLLDLQHPDGPDSQAIYLLERPRPGPAAPNRAPARIADRAVVV